MTRKTEIRMRYRRGQGVRGMVRLRNLAQPEHKANHFLDPCFIRLSGTGNGLFYYRWRIAAGLD
jgi:hypothetical protein